MFAYADRRSVNICRHLLRWPSLVGTVNSYDIKHGTSQPGRIVYVARSGYSSNGTCLLRTHLLFISQCNTQRRLGNHSSLSEYNIPPETWVKFSLRTLVFVFIGTWALWGRREDKGELYVQSDKARQLTSPVNKSGVREVSACIQLSIE
jgi:hypothetical protein